MMKIAVMGAGGVGGYFGGRLAAAGVGVTFIARGAHLAAIRGGGLRIESGNGDVHVRPAQATDRFFFCGSFDVCDRETGAFDRIRAARNSCGFGVGNIISILFTQ